MKYVSTFTGIGGFDLALDRAGATCRWQIEKDHTCSSVLARHWPTVRRHNDIVTAKGSDLGETIDLLCGGFPCQDLSVAGRRAGLAGERSGLYFELMRLADELRPRWLLFENVPGLLSSNGGRDMAAVVGKMEECGYGWAYRVLDAQYFGVPQRRRRIFLVGCLGDWLRAAEMLFESESLRGHPAPGGKKKSKAAGGTGSGAESQLARTLRSRQSSPGVNPPGRGGEDDSNLIIARSVTTAEGKRLDDEGAGAAVQPLPISFQGDSKVSYSSANAALGCGGAAHPYVAHTLRAAGADASEDGTGRGTPLVPVAFKESQSGTREGDLHATLDAHKGSRRQEGVRVGLAVRRLTPRECERLQGFPDDWTALAADGKAISDSARYRMLGNAVAVPCVEWIARRLIRKHKEQA